MADSDRIAFSPTDEKQIRSKSSGSVASFVANNFHAVRSAVAALERWRPAVCRAVSAERVGIAFAEIRRKELAHSSARATTATATASADSFAQDIPRQEGNVGRTLGESPHEVRVPLRAERHVHPHGLTPRGGGGAGGGGGGGGGGGLRWGGGGG
jgi:hypothetical protein